MKKCLIVYSDYYKDISKSLLNGSIKVLKKIKLNMIYTVLMDRLRFLN